ncbi:putative Thioredoxin domain-containing protein [Gammaproteobacteria bacterium]
MFKKGNSAVIELNPDNFIFSNGNVYIQHPKLLPQYNKSGLLAILAEWCGHCQRMKAAYAAVAMQLGDSFPMFYLDAVKHQDFVQKYKLAQGFPTIKYLEAKTGKVKEQYNGERDINGFLVNICEYSKVCKR